MSATYDWPESLPQPHVPLGEESSMPSISTPFEAGYVQTRARFTKPRRTYRLAWSFMSRTDLDTLLTFWEDDVKGGAASFNWNHPSEDTAHEVRFVAGSLVAQYVDNGWWSVNVEIQEV